LIKKEHLKLVLNALNFINQIKEKKYMPRGIPSLNETQKQEIIKRITDKGERAVDLAKEYKVDPKIIYNLLKTKANQHQAVLELAKLKRENEALISIIGQLVADSKIGKKKK
jgi:Mor family transcriptional regulator